MGFQFAFRLLKRWVEFSWEFDVETGEVDSKKDNDKNHIIDPSHKTRFGFSEENDAG